MTISCQEKLHQKKTHPTKQQALIHLACSLLYLLLVGFLFYAFPITSAAFPAKLEKPSDTEALYRKNSRFVSAKLQNLRYTGYAQLNSQKKADGYYYYVMDKKSCHIVLLSSDICGQGKKRLKEAEFYGSIQYADDAYDQLLSALSKDLSWTKSGIHAKVSPYYINEINCRHGSSIGLFAVLSLSALYAFGSILRCILCLTKPGQ